MFKKSLVLPRACTRPSSEDLEVRTVATIEVRMIAVAAVQGNLSFDSLDEKNLPDCLTDVCCCTSLECLQSAQSSCNRFRWILEGHSLRRPRCLIERRTAPQLFWA
jgi:hypothetical protein